MCDLMRVQGLEGIYFANAVDIDNEEILRDELLDEEEDFMTQENPIMSSKSASSSYARE